VECVGPVPDGFFVAVGEFDLMIWFPLIPHAVKKRDQITILGDNPPILSVLHLTHSIPRYSLVFNHLYQSSLFSRILTGMSQHTGFPRR
jgi:hypothetical protein